MLSSLKFDLLVDTGGMMGGGSLRLITFTYTHACFRNLCSSFI